MTTRDRIVHFFLALAFFGLCAVAKAQQPWDTNVITFDAPTSCRDGRPISACPVTEYRIERSATGSGTFTAIGTTPATRLEYVHTGVPQGTNCYRSIARSANGDSPPSNVHCVTNTPPAPEPSPPNPPANLRVIQTVAMSVKPDYDRLAFVTSQEVGRVALGTECDRTRSIGDGWYGVPRELVVWSGSNRPANVVARCG